MTNPTFAEPSKLNEEPVEQSAEELRRMIEEGEDVDGVTSINQQVARDGITAKRLIQEEKEEQAPPPAVRSFASAVEEGKKESAVRPRWSDVPIGQEDHVLGLEKIMDAERLVGLIRSGKSSASSRILVPFDMKKTVPVLHAVLEILAALAKLELIEDPSIAMGTVVFPDVFRPGPNRENFMLEAMKSSKRAERAIQALVALIDSAGRMPSYEQIDSPGGGRAVYCWIATLVVVYNEEQSKNIPLNKGRNIVKNLESIKSNFMDLLKVFFPSEEVANKILVAIEICLRRIAANWVRSQSAEQDARYATLVSYYKRCVKDTSDYHVELFKTTTTDVKQPVEGKKGQFTTKKVTNIIFPSINSQAPMGVKERAMVHTINVAIKKTLIYDYKEELITEPSRDTSRSLEKASRRVEAAYVLAKRCNDMLRARRNLVIAWAIANHSSVLTNVKTNPTTAKETHDLFVVIQPLWEKSFPDEVSLCRDFDLLLDVANEGTVRSFIHSY